MNPPPSTSLRYIVLAVQIDERVTNNVAHDLALRSVDRCIEDVNREFHIELEDMVVVDDTATVITIEGYAVLVDAVDNRFDWGKARVRKLRNCYYVYFTDTALFLHRLIIGAKPGQMVESQTPKNLLPLTLSKSTNRPPCKESNKMKATINNRCKPKEEYPLLKRHRTIGVVIYFIKKNYGFCLVNPCGTPAANTATEWNEECYEALPVGEQIILEND